MEKYKKHAKIMALLGVIVGVVGFAWASLDEGGKLAGSWMFVIGFLMLCFGVLANVLLTPNERFGEHSPWGVKIMAVGFAIAVVSNVLGEIFLGEGYGTGNIVFYLGSAIMFAGIVIHGASVFKRFTSRNRNE